ncbi:MAG: methyltransferase domain-containing protein [Crocinitomicaceae bacterium]|nr:methyltransferase domain-containing protein [Crocinitomicaceae bacterium]
MKNEWFASWFDTPYYHTLYKNRDEKEARQFVINLVEHLELDKPNHILDLACGRGRHSVTLNELGYNVLGVDLSAESIASASKNKSNTLNFSVHDMRTVIEGEQFGAIFNLFTSFGYFDETNDNERVLNSVHSMLASQGILVIDFMNANRVINNLVETEIKTINNITFNISRRYDGKHIFKDIKFRDCNESFHYTERVQALKKIDFEQLLSDCDFEILRTFGDFNLSEYNANSSDRLIIIARKK